MSLEVDQSRGFHTLISSYFTFTPGQNYDGMVQLPSLHTQPECLWGTLIPGQNDGRVPQGWGCTHRYLASYLPLLLTRMSLTSGYLERFPHTRVHSNNSSLLSTIITFTITTNNNNNNNNNMSVNEQSVISHGRMYEISPGVCLAMHAILAQTISKVRITSYERNANTTGRYSLGPCANSVY